MTLLWHLPVCSRAVSSVQSLRNFGCKIAAATNSGRKFGHGPGSLSSRSTFAALSMTEHQFAKCAENFCTAASDQKKNPVITASERHSLDGDDHVSKCHNDNVALVGKRHCGKRALTAVEDRNMKCNEKK